MRQNGSGGLLVVDMCDCGQGVAIMPLAADFHALRSCQQSAKMGLHQFINPFDGSGAHGMAIDHDTGGSSGSIAAHAKAGKASLARHMPEIGRAHV